MTVCGRVLCNFYSSSRSWLFSHTKKLQTPITTTTTRSYREIQATQDGKTTTIKGLMQHSVQKNIAPRHDELDKCPLRSRGIQITYEDVLILNQFITSTGELLSQEETGLCRHEYFKVIGCVKMAQRADMLPGPENGVSLSPKGKRLNTYLTRYPIGTRSPIRGRGLPYRRNYYRVGDARTMRDAPYVARRGMIDKH